MTTPFARNIGPYRVVEKMGQGGMATVYKAFQPGLDRYVALKVMRPSLVADPSVLARFRREARLVAQLEHPNIVPIYDYAQIEGLPYLVMKFIEGETLKDRLARGQLAKDELLRVVQAMGRAISFAHSKGVLHRDVKPSNVLLSPDGGIYLADFGLARLSEIGESTMSRNMLLGTPQYISPEQAQGEKELDEGTDIYSLGVVLFELVVGQVPFNADTPYPIIHDHIYTPLPLPSSLNPEVPKAVEGVLVRALAKKRENRFATVDELVAAFTEAIQEADMVLEAAAPKAPMPAASPPKVPGLAEVVKPQGRPAPEAPRKMLQLANGEEAVKKRRADRGRVVWVILAAILILLCGLSLPFVGPRALNAVRTNQAARTQQAAIAMTTTPGAAAIARATLQANPNDAVARLHLAESLYQAGKAGLAYEQLLRASDIYLRQGDYLNAAKALMYGVEQAGGIDKAGRRLLLDLDQALFLGASMEGFPRLLDALKADFGEVANLAVYEARSLLASGRIEDANRLIEKTLGENAADARSRAVQAEIKIAQGDTKGAQEILRALAKEAQLPGWLVVHLVDLRKAIGQPES